jgi:hypothetical protein
LTEEQDSKQSEYVIDRNKAVHPKFLEAIKESSPLAVLGSLCIAISAFTNLNFSNAQPFAITSAMLFLIAFLVSVAFKMFQESLFAPLFSMATYITVAFGIILLFGVVYFFASSIPLVSNTLSTILPALLAVLSIVFGVAVWWLNGKFRNLLVVIPFYFKISTAITVLAASVMAIASIFIAVNAFLGYIIEIKGVTQIEIGVSVLFGLSISIFYILAQRVSKGKRKNNRLIFDDDLIGCQY